MQLFVVDGFLAEPSLCTIQEYISQSELECCHQNSTEFQFVEVLLICRTSISMFLSHPSDQESRHSLCNLVVFSPQNLPSTRLVLHVVLKCY